jgi:hypothetical protein
VDGRVRRHGRKPVGGVQWVEIAAPMTVKGRFREDGREESIVVANTWSTGKDHSGAPARQTLNEPRMTCEDILVNSY